MGEIAIGQTSQGLRPMHQNTSQNKIVLWSVKSQISSTKFQTISNYQNSKFEFIWGLGFVIWDFLFGVSYNGYYTRLGVLQPGFNSRHPDKIEVRCSGGFALRPAKLAFGRSLSLRDISRRDDRRDDNSPWSEKIVINYNQINLWTQKF